MGESAGDRKGVKEESEIRCSDFVRRWVWIEVRNLCSDFKEVISAVLERRERWILSRALVLFGVFLERLVCCRAPC